MQSNEFWDESEYTFFCKLTDNDKLLYIYDLFIGEFLDDYMGNIEYSEDDLLIEVELDDGDENVSIKIDTVEVKALTDDKANQIAMNIMLDGIIITNPIKNQIENQIIQKYKLIGETNPISLN
jgi:hypothetical protein